MGVEYDPANLVDGDGVRPWHILTVEKIISDNRSFRLWVGSYNKRHLTESRINYRTDRQIFAMMGPGGFFMPEYVEHRGPCGIFWLGISRAPLSKTWAKVTSRWTGWSHVVHWKDVDAFQEIPHTEKVFNTACEILTETGYPKNLNSFSRELISELGLNTKSIIIYE